MFRFSRAHRVLLPAAFLMTGVGVALLGAALPAMLAEWKLSDLRAGGLIFAAWIGSASGPLFSRGNLQNCTVRACFLAGGSMVMLAWTPVPAIYAVIAAYGVGLGMLMTSISVWRARDAAADLRQRELNRLNMLWAIGAATSPWLTAHALRTLRVTSLFAAVGAAFLVLAALLALARNRSIQPVFHAMDFRETFTRFPLIFALFSALAVGAESSVGSWLTTYAQRTAHVAVVSISATSMFWTGLLLSRALSSTVWLHRIAPMRVLAAETFLAFIALTGLLVLPQDGLLPAALLAGLGLGPLYPFILSVVLPHYRGNAVFLIAGLGSAVTPWVTGLVSNTAGSLHAGLLVPTACALALFAAVPLIGSRISTHDTGEAVKLK